MFYFVLVFYFVLSVGGGSILAFIALARLQSLLNPDDMGAGKVKDLKDLRQRLAHWEQQQDEDRRAAMPPTVFKKNALGEFRYMLGIAALLALAFGIISFAGWTIIDVRYG